MGDLALLDHGAITKLITGSEEDLQNYAPVIQILGTERSWDPAYPTVVHISDGRFTASKFRFGSIPAAFATISPKDYHEFALIKLLNYSRFKCTDLSICVEIQKFEVIKKGYDVGKKLGNPWPFSIEIAPWVQPQNSKKAKFDGSGENEPGLQRVKADISKLQKALRDMQKKQKVSPLITSKIQELDLEYEQAKQFSCSNYKEIGAKITEIKDKYHQVLADYFTVDKLWWRVYGEAVVRMRIMLDQAQDHGYPGLDDFGSGDDFVGMISSLTRKVKANTYHKCISCSNQFSDFTSEDLDKNGVSGIYPSTQPTLTSICPKHEFEMQIVCSLKCDKIRYTKEVELLRNDGTRLTKRDLKWNLCQVCYLEKKLKKCGHCQMAYYCGKTCQESHWTKHKEICDSLKQMNELLRNRFSFMSSGDFSLLEYQMDCN